MKRTLTLERSKDALKICIYLLKKDMRYCEPSEFLHQCKIKKTVWQQKYKNLLCDKLHLIQRIENSIDKRKPYYTINQTATYNQVYALYLGYITKKAIEQKLKLKKFKREINKEYILNLEKKNKYLKNSIPKLLRDKRINHKKLEMTIRINEFEPYKYYKSLFELFKNFNQKSIFPSLLNKLILETALDYYGNKMVRVDSNSETLISKTKQKLMPLLINIKAPDLIRYIDRWYIKQEYIEEKFAKEVKKESNKKTDIANITNPSEIEKKYVKTKEDYLALMNNTIKIKEFGGYTHIEALDKLFQNIELELNSWNSPYNEEVRNNELRTNEKTLLFIYFAKTLEYVIRNYDYKDMNTLFEDMFEIWCIEYKNHENTNYIKKIDAKMPQLSICGVHTFFNKYYKINI